MGIFRIDVGIPESDGEYLLEGFSLLYANTPSGRHGRWVDKRARVKLPIAPEKENRIRIVCYTQGPQYISVFEKNRKCGEFKIERKGWNNLEFVLNNKRDNFIILTIECKNFYMFYRTAGYLFVNRIEIKSSGKIGEIEDENVRAPSNIYFGDLHVHSNFSLCGINKGRYNGTLSENYEYGLKEAQLDFMAITDHSEHLLLQKGSWEKSLEEAEKFYKEGRFVTFPAYEWTSEYYGHRNIYSSNIELPILSCADYSFNTPEKIYNYFHKKKDLKREVIIIPHHPCKFLFIGNWNHHNEDFENLIEIYSKWGSSEYYRNTLQQTETTVPGYFVQDALAKGLKMGFVAGSDGHALRPGERGLTAILADELTRESLFSSLRRRLVYATTGAKIKLKFRINNYPMGSVLNFNLYQLQRFYPLNFWIEVEGTTTIERVEILQNNKVIHTEYIPGSGGQHSLPFRKKVYRNILNQQMCFEYKIPRPNKMVFSSFYYVRVIQIDKHLAWSSPIWINLNL